ncbi:hypothetical protein TTHERM_001293241 (macronuclear) [Tetrahymena thermophila SB210]|uniref:Uncharacterized protein n=1 Tax=Tetrahymena thermophila (strain SB210) TaxID=312017 RepID=W7XLR7_TETTS|nr:hypothetical protein TTHERM_001293241 [Tetrahymena thermophila SB210]EWS76759.1 hypothetical protein TTHERM_001293241 [Tetrahymena thermophila SB210]|eukprot:XP_012650707.1 hypothetical protein TTHERM_001293241 [Tetrahymena thermophila SB210]
MNRQDYQRGNMNDPDDYEDQGQYSNKLYSRGYGQRGNEDEHDDDHEDYGQNRDSENNYYGEQDGQDPLLRLQKYIGREQISLETFWDSTQTQVLPDQFFDFCKKKAIKFDEREKQVLMKYLCDDNNYITFQQLCQQIPFWKNDEGVMTEFLKQKTQEKADNSKNNAKKQFRKQQFNIRPASSINPQQKRPISSISQHNLKVAKEQEQIEIPKALAPNKSKYYLQKHKEREKEIDRLLKLTISKGRNEYEYEMLIKMGEANELSQQLNSKVTYRAYRSAQGDLKVHIYELDKYKTSMTLEEFQREYNALKNKYNETRNLRIWEVLSENKKSKPKEFNKQSKEEFQQTSDTNNRGKINIQARHNELKGVLLKTMELTIVLKEQLAVINSVINNKKKKRPQSTTQKQSNSIKNTENM